VPLTNDNYFIISKICDAHSIRLTSEDGMNRLTRDKLIALTAAIHEISSNDSLVAPLVISGDTNFSAGADLKEIASLTSAAAYAFSALGQDLMHSVTTFPMPVVAAITGHCMGGGLDLALACHRRIAAPNAVFGHRGAALGLITGWGGTQRLPRLIGKGRALELFITSEKISAARAFEIGLVDAVAADPVAEATRQISEFNRTLRT
jgi:enoyl-CoA hydratase/carnithine racemase